MAEGEQIEKDTINNNLVGFFSYNVLYIFCSTKLAAAATAAVLDEKKFWIKVCSTFSLMKLGSLCDI